jgi:quercetin dioxygenase-like cupin family protein
MGAHEHGSFATLAEERPFDGIARRALSSANATVASYRLDPGAAFPLHRHASEQITLFEEGEVDLTVGATTTRMSPGDWSVIPPGVEHGIVATATGARFVAIVTPRREAGDDYELLDRAMTPGRRAGA